MGKKICVASIKGGTGKTTTTANLAIALTELGFRVLSVDSNIYGANLGIHFGLSSRNLNTIHDVLEKKARPRDAVYLHPSGVQVMLGRLYDNYAVDASRLPEVVNELSSDYDYVLIDSSSGLAQDVSASIESADELIIVTTPDLPSVANAFKLVEYAVSRLIPTRGVIINKFKNKEFQDLLVDDIESILGKQVIGIIHDDQRVRESIALRSPIVDRFPKSSAAKEFMRIASSISGKELPGDRRIWQRIMGKFKTI